MSPRLGWHGLDAMHTSRRTSSRRNGRTSGGVGGALLARNDGIPRRARRGGPRIADPHTASAPARPRRLTATWRRGFHVAPRRRSARPADTILGSCSRCLAQPLGRRAASWCSICCASSRSLCSTQQARQTLGQRAAHSALPRARVAPPPPARRARAPLSPAVGLGCRCPRPGGVGVLEWVQW